ncbi:phage late control D family protein [Prosthecomicrobium hirschii]|uniref:phage late control D family protein n=1 Tax=Prosthecodimorpha hirschii TaxID=665126 RepID=UPI00222043EB|nr:contractile injection system protein, VgrG/Pvc8 family [Prosthecomicrobium hirschii]MCW1842316.1 contractile injection system protein, VgrG/Pvc8 family [Prosthecomicrobium hirschii]
MSLRRPIVQVMGPSGRDLVGLWGATLAGLTITDKAGYESDEAVIRIRDVPPRWSAPAKGTQYSIHVGWETGAMALTGLYTVQRVAFSGSPDHGTLMEITCRAADFLDRLKEVDSEHFDGQTVGQIVQTLAGRMGVQAVVSSAVAGVSIPYRMRFQQSAGDFLTRLADDVGAIIKPQAGRLLVQKRGAGESAGGKALPTLTVRHDPLYEFRAEIEPRPEYRDVESGWIDPKTGLRTAKRVAGGFQSSRLQLVHPYASEGEAQSGADAAAQEHGRKSASASFSMPGRGDATAECRVAASGFGADIDAVPWIAASVTHEIAPDHGWVTTIECDTKGTGSKK